VAEHFTPEALEPRAEGAEWAAALAESYRPEAQVVSSTPSRWKTRFSV